MADILELSDEQLDSVSAGATVVVKGVPDSDLAREIAKACPGIQFFYHEGQKTYLCAVGQNDGPISKTFNPNDYRYSALDRFKQKLDQHTVRKYLTTSFTFTAPKY